MSLIIIGFGCNVIIIRNPPKYAFETWPLTFLGISRVGSILRTLVIIKIWKTSVLVSEYWIYYIWKGAVEEGTWSVNVEDGDAELPAAVAGLLGAGAVLVHCTLLSRHHLLGGCGQRLPRFANILVIWKTVNLSSIPWINSKLFFSLVNSLKFIRIFFF